MIPEEKPPYRTKEKEVTEEGHVPLIRRKGGVFHDAQTPRGRRRVPPAEDQVGNSLGSLGGKGNAGKARRELPLPVASGTSRHCDGPQKRESASLPKGNV